MRKEEMPAMGYAPIDNPVSADEETRDEGRFRRSSRILIVLLALVCLGLAVACALLIWGGSASGDTGSYIIPVDGMADEEAQEVLDAETEASRIAVSLAPTMWLRADGSLRVNFLVEEPNNGYAERVEIEQDGIVIYASGAVAPGYGIEWCQAPDAHAGAAVATVHAVDDDGNDRGNPVSVEVEIVDE